MELPAKEILDALDCGIIITDPNQPDDPITYVNPAFERTTGYSFEEAVGRNCRFLQGPDGDQPEIEELREALANGREWSGVLRNYRKSGESFWNELLISAVHDEAGNVKHFISVQQDVSQRVEAEERRVESERRLRSALLRYGSDVITILDSEGTVLYVSPSIEQSLGKKPEEHIGQSSFDLFHPDDVEQVAEAYSWQIEEGEPVPPVEFRLQHADGSWHHFEALSTDLLSDPEVEGIVVNSRDITERKRAERAMQESEERFRTLADAALEGLVVMNMEGQILETNQAYLEIFGFEPEEVMGQSAKINALPGTDPESRDTVLQNVVSHYEEPYEIVGRRKDGTRIDLQIRGRSYTYRGQEARITALRDITERKQAEEETRESEKRFRTLAEAAFEGIIVSEGATIMDVNPAGAALVGYETSEVIGKSMLDFVAPEYHEAIKQSMATGSEAPYEIGILHKDGTRIETQVRGRKYHYKGRPARVSAIRDISEQKSLERRLRHQALHDPLTGLPNRTLFSDRLTQSLERTSRSGDTVAVMFLDLDDFKSVNDTLGHSAGDELLVSVAGRLCECLRSSDTVSRMGGDEFTILLDGVDGEGETSQIAQRIVEQFRHPVTVSDGGMEREVSATVSMGVVLAAPGVGSGTTAEELLKWADAALYQSKASGKDHYLFFHPEMEEHSLERSSVEGE